MSIEETRATLNFDSKNPRTRQSSDSAPPHPARIYDHDDLFWLPRREGQDILRRMLDRSFTALRFWVWRMLNKIRTPKVLVARDVRSLIPRASEAGLIRIGPRQDGGYVVPAAGLQELSDLLSAGVDTSWAFEIDIQRLTQCRIHLIDGSMSRPHDLPGDFTFRQHWLRAESGNESIDLRSWMTTLNITDSNRLGLQMDIEQEEWEVLRSTPPEVLHKFQFIVVEIHGIQNIQRLGYCMRRIHPALKRLTRDFAVVHTHPNNCCGSTWVKGILIPHVLEVSLLRKDLVDPRYQDVYFGEALDAECVPSNPHIDIASWAALAH